MRALTFYDLETTGTSISHDRIVQIGVIRVGPDEEPTRFVSLVNPEMEIPRSASDVHGITQEDVALAPTFRSIAGEVREIIGDSILVGYNSRRFDSMILDREFRRARVDGLIRDSSKMRIVHPEIDLLRLWYRFEPRTLVGCVKRFTGQDMEGAHSAAADAEVLLQTLNGMERALPEFPSDPVAMADASIPDGEVDRLGKFRISDHEATKGKVVFAFGKHEGKVVDVRQDHIKDYLDWMLDESKSTFESETRAWCRHFLQGGSA